MRDPGTIKSGAEVLLMDIRGCKRCEGKHLIMVDSGPTEWGGYFQRFDVCPDCLQKVKKFAEGC